MEGEIVDLKRQLLEAQRASQGVGSAIEESERYMTLTLTLTLIEENERYIELHGGQAQRCHVY